MTAFDANIPWQPAEPARTEAAPERETDQDNYATKNDDQFSNLRHDKRLSRLRLNTKKIGQVAQRG